jgi:hypothetical protein
VILTAFNILRDISDILMERVPRAHNAETIQAAFQAVVAMKLNTLSLLS